MLSIFVIISKNKCTKDGKDAFETLYKLIGYTTSFAVTMGFV